MNHDDHPGHDSGACHLRIIISASSLGISSNGYACSATGGHCLPGEYCDDRRAANPGTGLEGLEFESAGSCDGWSSEWPDEPGWYWCWQPTKRDGKPGWRDPVRVIRTDNGRLLYNVLGECAWPDTRPDIRWGQRIPVPDAPDGTPGTRYAVAMICDQTITYLTELGQETTRHAEIELFTDRLSAEYAMRSYRDHVGMLQDDIWIEAIDDIDDFRGRPNTW